MASIDLARREMACRGERLLDEALALARDCRVRLAAVPGLTVLGSSDVTGPGTGHAAADETKILIGVSGLGLDGGEVVRILNADFNVQPELAGRDHVLCILTIGNTRRDVDRLVDAFVAIAKQAKPKAGPRPPSKPALASLPEVAMTPRDAFFAAAEAVALETSVGRIAAEVVTPYPPGIPVLMPGERVSIEIVELLRAVLESGTPISASDPSLSTMKVIR
jgi:arginine/lysine/ornithine decarboxylase